MSGTPLALLSLGVALRSATLLSATLEHVGTNDKVPTLLHEICGFFISV